MNDIRPTMGSNGWHADQQRAKEADAQAEARRQAEADRDQPAPVPQSAQQRAFAEAAKLYDSIMAEEQAKTANQREAETLDAEIGTLWKQIRELSQNPVQNRKQIEQLEKRTNEAQARHDSLTGNNSVDKTYRVSSQGFIR
jgi:hypothetical protein